MSSKPPELFALDQRLQAQLQERDEAGLLRRLPHLDPQGIDFCSNDYLGLAKQTQLDEPHPHGSTGSRLISGNFPAFEALEDELARFHGTEAALVFSTGYAANLGVISALAGRHDLIILDELAHASMHDAVQLSGAKRWRFRHNNVVDLEAKIKRAKASLNSSSAQVWVIIEAIYSMDGDTAPLQACVEVCQRNGAYLLVDEAHSIGVVGEAGEGLVTQLGLQRQVAATIVPCGKAPGVHGAYVLGSSQLKQFLVNFSRPFIYSTALSPAAVAALTQAHRALRNSQPARKKLQKLIHYFRCEGKSLGYEAQLLRSESPIQGVIVPGEQAVRAVAHALRSEGLQVVPIVSPTVPKGEERLRLCLHAYNTEQEVDFFWEKMKKAYVSP